MDLLKRHQEADLYILKWHVFLGPVGMYVQSFMELALCVLEFRHVVQNGALPQTLEANRSQSGRSMNNLKETFCLQAIEILFTDLRDFLDQKWMSTVQKCVLDKSACWWRYNRPM